MMRATAFCPGHITGFFEICESVDVLSGGSRGAGLCITLGATSEVTAERSTKREVRVTIDGRRSRAEVTKEALGILLGDEMLDIEVRTTMDLPQSQGFGMSAAGALSSSLALAQILGMEPQKAFEAAHEAELSCRTGLGDVSAIRGGGIEIRRRPGLPPRGEILRIDGAPEVVLAVVGRRLLTKSVLENPERREAINRSGSQRVEELISEPTLEKFMQLSFGFAQEVGLASNRVLAAISAASKLGMASMSMLGNSVFAVGDIAGLQTVLSDFGQVWTCRVDRRGPHLR